MNKRTLAGALVLLTLATPVAAQNSDTETLVEALKKRDGSTAAGIVDSRGTSVINRRSMSGETALIAAIANRDADWTLYLLNKGADPNLPTADGETPLITAARIGFADAAEWLIIQGANVNGRNRRCETALIVAVQQRRVPMVRLLMSNGADPDITDAAAGLSAREYAERDTRSRNLVEIIDTTTPSAPSAKNADLNSFKLGGN